MGIVYKAEDTKLKRTVALKFLSLELTVDPDARERFVTEAQAASRLDHPNICTIHEIDETADGRMYIAMPYYEGQTLKEKIQSKALDLQGALDIIRQLAQGLAKAHAKGIVHRDIKPANVIVTEDELVKVVDFGLAKLAGRARLTKTGYTMGTVNYMSPEQALGKEVDARSDIWSLGVVLYEILAGRLPFRGDNEQSVLYQIINREPEPMSSSVSSIPTELERIVNKALEKDQEARYQSFDELLIDLREVYRQMDIKADWRIPRRSILGKKRWIASPAAWILLAVLVGVTLGLVLFFPSQAIPFQERDWILLTNLMNQTEDEVFDGALDTALTVSLQQSRYANVFPRDRVKETFQRMNQEMPERLDVETAAEVAQREGISAVIACRISSIGSTYALSAEIIDPETLVSLKTVTSQAQNRDEVLVALDDLAVEIRRDLGESLREINSQRVSLPLATTSSLEALKKFSEGQWFWDTSNYHEAGRLWEDAVALDPDFAWAHANLGAYLYYWGNDRKRGDFHFERTLNLLDRLTEREKLVIIPWIESWRGNQEQAIQHYKILVSRYPDDRAGWYNLGNQYLRLNRYEEALEAYTRTLEIDPLHAWAITNTATCYNILGQEELAIEYYNRAFELRPDDITSYNINHEYGLVYVKLGDYQKAEEVYRLMLAKDNSRKSLGYRSLALLDMYRGKYETAMEHLRETILINQTRKALVSEVRDRLYLAVAYATKGREAAVRKELDTVMALRNQGNIAPWWLVIAVKLYIRQGWMDQAAVFVDDITQLLNHEVRNDRFVGHILKGEMELARGNFDDALAALELAYKEREDNYALESLAYAAWKQGDLDKAISHYERLISRKHLGWEAQEYWIEAHYRLGRIYEERGESDKAVSFYQTFLEIWKEADPDIPMLMDAQARLARLPGL